MHLPVCDIEGPCQHRLRHPSTSIRGVCGSTRDTRGFPVFSCHAGGHLIARHDRLRALRSQRIEDLTGNPALVEQNTDVTDDNRRPNLCFQNWRGEARWVDVAVVSPFARAAGDPRHAQAGVTDSIMEGVKRRKYAALALVPAICFHFGRPGQDLISLFRSLGRDSDIIDLSSVVASLWQDWSCTLQKWNCNALASSGELIAP